jgi:outer membrane protein assembly factor BamB
MVGLKVKAADALAMLGEDAKGAVPALLGVLSHDQPWVRSSASAALVAAGEEAVPALIELFREQNGGPSIRAAFILGSIGVEAKPAASVIEGVMRNESAVMQARYAGILNQIDPERYPGNQTRGILQAGRVNLGAADEMADVTSPLAADWPQFHGPNRDSVCLERGLLQEWPEGGPDLLWTLEGLGRGFSTVSIANNRLVTMGDRSTEGDQEAQFVLAYDLQTRKELWATQVGPPFRTGPRCTPTIDAESVYALGTEGSLVALDSATGQVLWRRSLPEDFGGRVMSGWKYCESPLVDGDRLVCTPGGDETLLVALNRRTGEQLWACKPPSFGDAGADGAGYSSIVVTEIHGIRQYVQMVGRGVVGVEAETGRFLWGYNRIACNVANITAPLVHGNYVFVSTAYNTGSALLEVHREGNNFRAEEVYFLGPRDFQNHHGGLVRVGKYVYGGHRPNSGDPTCIDLATGRVCWSERSPARGSGSVLYADGHLIFRYDRGEVLWVETTPEVFRIKGRFTAVKGEGPAWAHPVIHQGKLYLRHGDALGCYDLRAAENKAGVRTATRRTGVDPQ